MRKIIDLFRRHGIDILTCATLASAAFLLSRPIRDKWTKHRAEIARAGSANRNWQDISTNSSPLAATPAPMQVVEISDYECPFCRRSSAAVDSAVSAGTQIAYLNYPLPSHPHAEGAAIAALCAGFSGRFREMHARLMGTNTWESDTNWTREAKAAGVVDLPAFDACTHGSAVRTRLAHERALADSLGVYATPTFVSRQGVHHGVASAAELAALEHRE